MQYCTYKNRKPGRPKAIPVTMEVTVIDLYKQGLGYRAIKRELGKEGLLVHWSTVRRFIKRTLWTTKPLPKSALRSYRKHTDNYPQ